MAKCLKCGQGFTPRRKNQLYCSTECRIDKNNEIIKLKYRKIPQFDKAIDELNEYKKLGLNPTTLKNIISVVTQEVRIVTDKIERINTTTIKYRGRNFEKKKDDVLARTLNYKIEKLKFKAEMGGIAYFYEEDALFVKVGSFTNEVYVFKK